MSEWQTVTRPVESPTGKRGRPLTPESRAVLETAETGKALRLPVAPDRSRFYDVAKAHGLRLYTRLEPDKIHMIAWCEKRSGT